MRHGGGQGRPESVEPGIGQAPDPGVETKSGISKAGAIRERAGKPYIVARTEIQRACRAAKAGGGCPSDLATARHKYGMAPVLSYEVLARGFTEGY